MHLRLYISILVFNLPFMTMFGTEWWSREMIDWHELFEAWGFPYLFLLLCLCSVILGCKPEAKLDWKIFIGCGFFMSGFWIWLFLEFFDIS